MGKMNIGKVIRGLRRALLLGLCLALAAGTALAAEVVSIGTEGFDSMAYQCRMPDGRVLFSGCRGKLHNYANQKARLLCLNPDMTAAWEYTAPDGGGCFFSHAGVTADGNIVTIFENSPYQSLEAIELRFYTAEGKPTGRKITLDPDYNGIYRLLPSGLVKHSWYRVHGKLTAEYEFIDWDGNRRFQVAGGELVLAESIIEEEDGLVLLGREAESGGCPAAKIMKIDWKGKETWENTLPFMMDLNEGASLQYGMKTSDGGYAALLMESGSSHANGKEALVKFSPSGRVLWMNTESFEERMRKNVFDYLAEYRGGYVIGFTDGESWGSLAAPLDYLWIDAEGKEIGTTELRLEKKELPRLSKGKSVALLHYDLVATESGVWQELSGYDERNSLEDEQDSQEDMLVRVPEP